MIDVKDLRDRGQYRRSVEEGLPDRMTSGDTVFEKKLSLRYGENPPALPGEGGAAVYVASNSSGPSIATAAKIHGEKDLGYINVLDADAGLRLCLRLHELFPDDYITAIEKHAGPCGVGRSGTMAGAHQLAYLCDPLSSFGGVNVYTGTVDDETARHIVSYFNEVVVAPNYTPEAMAILKGKKDLRVLKIADINLPILDNDIDERSILGGKLAQQRMKSHIDTYRNLEKVTTGRGPTIDELDAALFNWQVALYTSSNAVILGTSHRTVGIGRGQPSRVDSTRQAIWYANNRCEGYNSKRTVMASDAFFPDKDSVTHAGEAGVSAIVFPLGSTKDAEAIAEAEKYGIVMLCTRPAPGENKIERGFRH